MMFFKQLALLIHKNLLLVWRSKLWTLFELALPLLILVPIVLLVVYSNFDTLPAPAQSYREFPVTGDAADIDRATKFIPQINTRLCNKDTTLAYFPVSDKSKSFMDKLERRYADRIIGKVHVEPYTNKDEMVTALRRDLDNGTCGRFIGGVEFTRFDPAAKELAYTILMPVTEDSHRWPTDAEQWRSGGPFGLPPDPAYPLPGSPPYWSSGFLSIQMALDSIFLEMANTSIPSPSRVTLQRFPEPEYLVRPVHSFLALLPVLWGLVAMLNVIHTARTIAGEKEAGLKAYLSVMGLNASVFYLSHLVVSFIKIAVVFLICAILLLPTMENMDGSLFVVTVMLYGLSALCVGMLIASIFHSSSAVIRAVIIIWIVLVALCLEHFRSSQIWIFNCIWQSLNPNTAFANAIATIIAFDNRGTRLTWSNMFADSSLSFSYGLAVTMLLVDIIWMCLLTVYLDNVYPAGDTPRKPLLFCFQWLWPGNWCCCKTAHLSPESRNFMERQSQQPLTDAVNHSPSSEHPPTYWSSGSGRAPLASQQISTSTAGMDLIDAESIEPDTGFPRDKADIEVSGMTKIWNETGQRAVDRLSFRAFRGQVTVLLGHNGAGKSTTFAVLTGMTTPSSGSVRICQMEMAGARAADCQQELGFCPQYNALFDRLTVVEHLKLFRRLKQSASNIDNVDEILEQIGLTEKRDTLASALSGGMKRKLCVGIALVGGSRVVILDEPTAGMDAGARHVICDLLERHKANRTILMTTHYMEEADLLGDRVAIMAKGRLVCAGSSTFLKQRFATGYLLTIALDEKSGHSPVANRLEQVIALVRRYIPSAHVQSAVAQQIVLLLPVDSKICFVRLFEDLEASKAQYGITSFGLSLNTLEQVFLKVGEAAQPGSATACADQTDAAIRQASHLYGDKAPRVTGCRLWLEQMAALLWKRAVYGYRHWSQFIPQLIIPIAMLAACSYWFNKTDAPVINKVLQLTPNVVSPARIPLQLWTPSSSLANGLANAIKGIPGYAIESVPKDANFTRFMLSESKTLPARPFAAVVTNDDGMIGYFNGHAYHSPAIVLSQLSNARLGRQGIAASLQVYDRLDSGSAGAGIGVDGQSIVIAPLLIFAFSLITSGFVMFLVEERASHFLHQQLLTRMSPLTYWLSVIVYDMLIYAIACAAFMAIFLISDWMHGNLQWVLLLWTLYFWSCTPFVYCVSRIFASSSKAYVLLVCWNMIAALVAMLASFALSMYLQMMGYQLMQSIVQTALLLILPSYAFGRGFMSLATLQVGVAGNPLDWDILGRICTVMLISGCFFWILLVLIQSRKFAWLLHSVFEMAHRRPKSDQNFQLIELAHEDADVRNERADVDRLLPSTGDHRRRISESDVLVVRNLDKFYGRLHAVKRLSFTVKRADGNNPPDCFGLLGVNGAGKTSTFDILTGVSFMTDGEAFIDGHSVRERLPIGYCPQFDALLPDLTGRETLQVLAKLHGFEKVDRRMETVLEAVGMMEHADKLVKHYSGGQRRRLSMAVALLAETPLILLDEPTAGIDPKARRQIWTLLQAVRDQGCAMLLTSHSMDECEALCTRIGIMNRGRLIAIGPPQHIKSRFGRGYCLEMSLKEIFHREMVIDAVRHEFSTAQLKEPSTGLQLQWEIAREKDDRWSALYRRVTQLAGRLPVRDYALHQMSLEQAFLQLSQAAEAEEPMHHRSRSPTGINIL